MASNIDVLNESTRVAQEAAKAAGLTFTPGATVVGGQIKPTTVPASLVNNPQTDLKFPTLTGSGDLASALASTKAMSTALTSQRESDLNKEATAYQDQLKTLLGRQENKPLDLASAMETAGVNKITKEQSDLEGLIATKTAALESGLTNIEGKAIPMELLTGEQAQLRRQGLAEIGTLQARQQVLAGNLTAAKDAAQRAVDLIYAPEEQRIKNIQTFLELNQNELTKEEKKKADLLTEALRIQQTELADKKTMQSYALNASANYPDAGISPSDSVEVVNRKVLSSPSYKQEQIKTTTSGNVLTLNEARTLGLPISLAGKTELQIANELNSENVPEWFRQFTQEKEKASIIPTRLKTLWDTFRNTVLGGKTTTSSSGGLDFDSL